MWGGGVAVDLVGDGREVVVVQQLQLHCTNCTECLRTQNLWLKFSFLLSGHSDFSAGFSQYFQYFKRKGYNF